MLIMQYHEMLLVELWRNLRKGIYAEVQFEERQRSVHITIIVVSTSGMC